MTASHVRRNPPRNCRVPLRYKDDSNVVFGLVTDEGNPSNFQKALEDRVANKWMTTMHNKMNFLYNNEMW
ncbi:hypothetical protein PJO48_29615, partial [Mycobacterium kansasii]